MNISRVTSTIALTNKKPILSRRIKKVIVPVLFLLPGVAFTLLLRYYLIAQAIYLSFFEYDVTNPPGKFVGIQNFINMVHDAYYWNAWKNTLVYLGLILLITFAIPIIQALFLEEIIKFRSFAQTLYILPAVIPGTVNIVLWKWIWEPQYGVANYVLKVFGAEPMAWLSDKYWVKFCIILPGIIGGGMGVLLYLAAIMGISQDVKEASMLDGCTGFRRMFHITLPNIRFLIFIQLVLTTMGALQILDGPFQYTNGGPAHAAEPLSLLVYHYYFVEYDWGKGSATALTMMVIISIITFVQIKMNNQQTE